MTLSAVRGIVLLGVLVEKSLIQVNSSVKVVQHLWLQFSPKTNHIDVLPPLAESTDPLLFPDGIFQNQENARPFVVLEKPNRLFPVCVQKTGRMLKWMNAFVRKRPDQQILCPVWLMFVPLDGKQRDR